jgi:hypothetical protein
MVSREATPVRAPEVETFRPPDEVRAKLPVALPMATVPLPVVAMVTLEAPALARSVAPVEVRVVNLPEAAVVAPIWVALIPVAVVLKVEAPVPEVMVRALVP